MIKIRRISKVSKNQISPYYEARFVPAKCHSDGEIKVRYYDGESEFPYRLTEDRDGKYWAAFGEEVLWDEEKELWEALKEHLKKKSKKS